MHAHSSLSLHRGCVAQQQQQQTNRGGRRTLELARRETGALISDGLTGCVDRAVAQEEEERCNGRTSRRKNRSKKLRSKPRETWREE
ncbi:hypothetical protein NQZ68_005616 [Dissostichus eleginoides]|nr:hypothetical protein NQZ68_005616 [Dissostichus eleginoides]